MPGYITKQLQKYEHIQNGPPEGSSYQGQIKKYGTASQGPISEDTSTVLSKNKKRQLQLVCWKHTELCKSCCHYTPYSSPLLLSNPKPYNSLWIQWNNFLNTAQCTIMQILDTNNLI